MIFEYLRIAAKVLWSHKFRSGLTVLSITIGAFSIVLMSSLAESGLATLSAGIEELGGARLILVYGKPPERAEGKLASYTGGLTMADWDQVFAELPNVVERTRYAALDRKDVVADSGVSSRTDLAVGDGGFLTLFRMRLAKGRGITEEENRLHARVCVVGHELAKKLWDGDALGHWMTISGVRCQVVGQLANQDRWGANFGFDWLDVAVVPFETAADALPILRLEAGNLVKTAAPTDNEVVKRIINTRLEARHHGVDDFQILDFAKIMDRWDHLFAIMKVIVGFIAGIALLVGGIGVMNMMLVSVSERVREIGIRKALGASPADIMAQFLCEAIVLSGVGGLIGVGGGVAMTEVATTLIRHYKPIWVGIVAQNAVIAALSVSFGVGLVFGLVPARRASRLDIIQAIRR
jgi:putative ABC transport system permease protein